MFENTTIWYFIVIVVAIVLLTMYNGDSDDAKKEANDEGKVIGVVGDDVDVGVGG